MGGTTTMATPPTTTSILLSLRGARATAPMTTATTIPNPRYIMSCSSRLLQLLVFYCFVFVFEGRKMLRWFDFSSLSVCLVGCCVFVPLQAVVDGYWLRMR